MEFDQKYLFQRQQMLNQFYSSKQQNQQDDYHSDKYMSPNTGHIDTQNSNIVDETSPSNPQELIASHAKEQRQQLLILTVQIDENRTGVANVYEGDDPTELAQLFCHNYNINTKIVPLLAQNIKNNIDQAMRERNNMRIYLESRDKKSELQMMQPQIDSYVGNQNNSSSVQSKILQSFSTQKNTNKSGNYWNQEVTFSPKINKNSRKLAKNRSFDSGTSSNVCDRLYQDAQNKLMRQQLIQQSKEDQINEQLLKNNQNKVYDASGVNYGIVLYQKGLKRKEEKMSKVESVKRDKISQQLQECTHKPAINEISRVLAHRQNEPIGDHLNKIARVMIERKEQAKNQKVLFEDASCSFHPQINKISQNIVDEKQRQNQSGQTLPRYQNLYLDSRMKQMRIKQKDQQLFNETCSFQPKIDKISNQIVQGTSFNDRLQKYQQDRATSKEKSIMREQEQLMYESQLFKPKTGRAPENRTNDPFASLYNHSIIQAQNKAQKQTDLQEQLSSQSKSHPNQLSNKLINSATMSALQDVFEMLDSDNDGQIDAQHVDVTQIQRKALEVLEPLLLEMEEGKHTLNKQEFIDSTLRLLNTLSVQEKHDLLFGYKRKAKQDISEFTFHVYLTQFIFIIFQPMINERSQKIAASKRPYGTPQVYDMFIEEKHVSNSLFQFQKEFDRRISQLKQAKDEQELQQQLAKQQQQQSIQSKLSRSLLKYN